MFKKIHNYREEMSIFQGFYRFKDPRFKMISSIHLSLLNYKKTLTCSVLAQSLIYKDIPIINAFNVIQSEKKILQCILEQENENYAVWLCDQGIWKLIILDADIPSQNSSQKTPSTIITDHEWPILFEKAIVKLLDHQSGYDVLNKLLNYSIEPFLFMLTGQQAEIANIKSFNELQSQMGQQILFYVLKLKKTDQICYSIVETKIQGTQELVVLRATSADLVVQGARQINGAVFHLEWKDFLNNFAQIYQIRWLQDDKHQAFKLENPTERKMTTLIEYTYVYSFKIDKEATVQAMLCQRDQNLNTKTQQKQEKYALCRLAFFKHEGDLYHYIGGKFDNQQNISLNLKLKPGEEYIMFCQAYFKFDQLMFLCEEQSQLNLQFQGESVPNEIKLVKQLNQAQLLLGLISQNINPKNTRNFASFGQPRAQVTTQTHLGLLIFYYLNLGTASVDEQVVFEESENLLNYETLKPQNSFKVVADPLSRDEMIVYCFDPEVLNKKNGFSFQYRLQITQKLSLSSSQKSNPQEQSIEKSQEIINLTELIKKRGRKTQFYEQDVNLYVFQHDSGIIYVNLGVILLFENQSNTILKFQADVALTNLYMNCAKELIVDNQLKFALEKKKQQFIYLDVREPNQPYQYKISNQYSFVSNIY